MLVTIKTILEQYGFGAAMACFVAFILWYVLKFAKENIVLVLSQAKDREDSQRKVIDKQHKAVRKLATEVRQVGQQQSKDHEKISKGLTEIVTSLGRINGYKKH